MAAPKKRNAVLTISVTTKFPRYWKDIAAIVKAKVSEHYDVAKVTIRRNIDSE